MPQPSRAALDLIEREEITSPAAYNPRPTWPGGASGVTIGIGYDLGYHSAARIGQDWRALPAGAVTRLCSYALRTGQQAAQLARAAQDITVPYAVARQVFETVDIPATCLAVDNAFPGSADLSPDSYGALVSVVFNRGAGMDGDRRLEMRQIRDALATGDLAAIPGYIRAMKRLWEGQGMAGLLARRDAEADLFQAGLS